MSPAEGHRLIVEGGREGVGGAVRPSSPTLARPLSLSLAQPAEGDGGAAWLLVHPRGLLLSLSGASAERARGPPVERVRVAVGRGISRCVAEGAGGPV
jgi:hypothetical protein